MPRSDLWCHAWQVDDPQRFTSMLAMIGQLSAALVATPAGHVSDRYGRKPLVYASCFIMATVYFSFALAPKIDIVLALGVGCTRTRSQHFVAALLLRSLPVSEVSCLAPC